MPHADKFEDLSLLRMKFQRHKINLPCIFEHLPAPFCLTYVPRDYSKTSLLKTISDGCHLQNQPVKINFPPIKNVEWFTYMYKNRHSKIDAIQSTADSSSLPSTLNLLKSNLCPRSNVPITLKMRL